MQRLPELMPDHLFMTVKEKARARASKKIKRGRGFRNCVSDFDDN
jgi:hypothetical protein